MTAQLAPELLSPETRAVLDELANALGSAVDAWKPVAPGQWRRVDGDDGPHELEMLAPRELDALCEAAAAADQVCQAEAGPHGTVLAAPIRDAAGAIQTVAVARVDARAGDYAVKLADAVLRERRLNQEMEWLRDENFVFSHQVTDDFEELTFLRTMATRLVVDDTSLNIHSIVDRTIGDLREMIGAETLYFVTSSPDGALAIGRICPAKPGDEGPIEADTILRLARVHRAP